MPTVTTSLKVEDKNYKQKLEQAKKELQNLSDQQYKSTSQLIQADKKLEQAKAGLVLALQNENKVSEQALKNRIKMLNADRSRILSRNRAIENSKKIQQEIVKEDKAVNGLKGSTDSLTNSVVRHLRQIETLVIAYYTLRSGWENTIGIGIEVNKIIESNTMGIAALTSANTRMVDSLGNTLTPFEKFAMGQKVATKAVEDLRVASVKTYATFPQLLEIYQQAIGQTMSMGGAFGETVDDVSKNTIELSKTLSNIAGSIGMPMDRVREEIRSMLSGNASTDSLISTMLFGSPGEANKAIRDAKGRTNGVVDLLNDMMKDFKILETTRTYQKGILTLQDSWSRAMGDMVQKSGMFQDITDMFYEMSDGIKDNTDDIIDAFDDIYNNAKLLRVPLETLVDIGIEVTEVFSILFSTIGDDESLGAFKTTVLGASAALDTIYVALNNVVAIASKLKPSGNVFADIYNLSQIDLQDLNKGILSTEDLIDRYIDTYEKITKASNKKIVQSDDINKAYEDLLNKKLSSDKEYYSELEKLNAETRIKIAKERAEKQSSLLMTIGVDKKQLEEAEKLTEKYEDKIVKLKEKQLEFSKAIDEYQKKYNENVKANTLDEQTKATLTESMNTLKEANLSIQKEISEEEQKRADALQKEADRQQRALDRREKQQFKYLDSIAELTVKEKELALAMGMSSEGYLLDGQARLEMERAINEERFRTKVGALQGQIDEAEFAVDGDDDIAGQTRVNELMAEMYSLQKERQDDLSKTAEDRHALTKKQMEAQRDLQILEAETSKDNMAKERLLSNITLESKRAEYQALVETGILTKEQMEYAMKMEGELEQRRLGSLTAYGRTVDAVAQSMENSFMSFFDATSEGFMDLKALGLDMAKEVYQALLRNYIVGQAANSTSSGSGIVGAITGLFNTSSTSSLSSIGGIETMGYSAFANGGVVSSPSLSNYSNSVVNSPTPFYFASGGVPSLGVMGEAGSEAIMPLTRTSGGDLGVKMVGGNQAPQSISVSIINESGEKLEVTDSSAKFDLEGTVMSIVLNSVATNKYGARKAIGNG